MPLVIICKYSQTSSLKHLGSQTIRCSTKLFTEKVSQLSSKTLGLSSMPDTPFILTPEDQSHVSQVSHKGDAVFKQITS